MYLPKHFHTDDQLQIQAFLQQNYFGLLLSSKPELLYSPLPFLFDWQEQRLTAYCHLARNNPQLKQLDQQQVHVAVSYTHLTLPTKA